MVHKYFLECVEDCEFAFHMGVILLDYVVGHVKQLQSIIIVNVIFT